MAWFGRTLVIASLGITGCGVMLGTSTPNDTLPTGQILAQGTFTNLAGNNLTGTPVSGTAVVYKTGTGFTVRLNGISAPSENSLMLVVLADSQTVLNTGLRATSGNQNYGIALNFTPSSWNQVSIHSSIKNMDYGQSLLVQCTGGSGGC